MIWQKHWRKSSEELRRDWSWHTDKVCHYIILLCTVQKWDLLPRRLKPSPVSGKVREVGASISVGTDTCERLEPLSIEVYNKSWILCTEGCSLLPVDVGDLGSWSLVWVGALCNIISIYIELLITWKEVQQECQLDRLLKGAKFCHVQTETANQVFVA